MTAQSLSRTLGDNTRTRSRAPTRWLYAGVALVALLAAAGSAGAADTLNSVSYQTRAGGDVDVALVLESGTVEAAVFATSDPPRIAIDLPDTKNKFEPRMLSIGTGATKSVTAVEAGGRTRVVIDLYRPSAYTTRKEGKSVIVAISNGFAESVSSKAPSDPAKSIATAPTLELSNIDFRRGKAGEARLILSFSGEGANADLKEEAGKLVLDLANISVPERFRKRLDVVDFATPVESIDVKARNGGARMTFETVGEYEKLAYQAGQEYVVEISKKVEVPKARAASDPPVYVGNRVTFNFQDIPVRSVLQLVADVSEINIVVADSVQGNVTLRLINVPWDQALDIILQAKGLDKRRNGNVMWVAPTEEIAKREQALEDARIALQDRAELMVDYISVSYGKAEDLAKLMTTDSLKGAGGGGASEGQSRQSSSGLLSDRGSISFDSRTNTLIVTDIPERIAKVRSLVAILDKPVKQVLIEARIVIADEGVRKELGARFGVSSARERDNGDLIAIGGSLVGGTSSMIDGALQNRNAGLASGLPVAPPNVNSRLNFNLPVTGGGAGSFATSILGADYILDMELSALESEQRGELLSSPKVITADQQEAVIKQGQEIGYVTIQQSGSGGGGGQATVAFKEVVLQLLVTPRITADGRVFLAIVVKKDNVAGFVDQPGGGSIPIIDKREVQTGALVDNGQTVVLGGIYEIEKSDRTTKVPLLGDIPAIGNLFRNRARSNSKTELLIFVTPRILTDVQTQ